METVKLQELEILSMKNTLVDQNEVLRSVSEIMLTAEQQSYLFLAGKSEIFEKSAKNLVKMTSKVMVEFQNQNRSFDTEAMRESITRALVHTVRQNLDSCVRQEIQTSIASSI